MSYKEAENPGPALDTDGVKVQNRKRCNKTRRVTNGT